MHRLLHRSLPSFMLGLSLGVSLLAFGIAAQAQQTMNNDAVIKMSKVGLSDEVIISSINANPGSYDTSTDGLVALKKAKVSDKVVSALIMKSAAPPPAAAPAPGASAPESSGGFNPTAGTGGSSPAAATGGFGSPAGASGFGAPAVPPSVDSVGVYYQDPGGAWQEVPAEVVNFKTGGALKHIASVGIVKGDMNGNVAGNRSRLAIKLPAAFIIYVPEGTSPGEYQLLRLHINPDNREFRSVTGGVVHESGGASQAAVDFTTKKLAPRIYQVNLTSEVGKGEYGFLPPQDSGSGKSMAASGKMYTFSLITE